METRHIPSHKSKAKVVTVASEDDDSSQDFAGAEIMAQAKRMITQGRHRRETTRANLTQAHAKKVKDVGAKINELFESRKKRVTRAQKAQWDRLNALNEKRAAIEAQILTSMQSIQHHTVNITAELNAILDSLSADLRGDPEQ